MLELLRLLLTVCRPVKLFRWVLLLVAFVVGWLVMDYATLQEHYAARERLVMHEETLESLKRQKKDLEKLRNSLQSNGFAAEKEARETLKMAMPGEKIIFIDEPTTGPTAKAQLSATPTPTVTATPTPEAEVKEQPDPTPTPKAKQAKNKRKVKGRTAQREQTTLDQEQSTHNND